MAFVCGILALYIAVSLSMNCVWGSLEVENATIVVDSQEVSLKNANRRAAILHEWNKNTAPSSNVRLLMAVRHGQSEHNLWEEIQIKRIQNGGPELLFSTPDASLTEYGASQCVACKEEMSLMMEKLRILEEQDGIPANSGRGFCLDAFASSPNSRALQTATIAFDGLTGVFACDPEAMKIMWLLTPHLRERTHNIADVGLPYVVLVEKVKWLKRQGRLGSTSLDFSLVEAESDWFIPRERSAIQIDKEKILSDLTLSKQDMLREFLRAPVFVKGFVPFGRSIRLRYYRNSVAYSQYSDFVPMELQWMVQARTDAFISAVCSVPNLRSLAVVAHLNLLGTLTGYDYFSNAEMRLFEINCDSFMVRSLET